MSKYPPIPLIQQMISIPRRKPPQGIRHKFSRDEDEQLKNLVDQLGDLNWNTISERMANRTPRQCRERYKNYLQPNLNTDEWSNAEEELLRAKYSEYGPKWSKIASFFTNRADVNIKNHWVQMEMRKKRENEAGTQCIVKGGSTLTNAPDDWYDPIPHWNFSDDSFDPFFDEFK